MRTRIMPGPYGRRPRPEGLFANWLIVGCLGLVMMQLGANQTAGFMFAVVGFIAALLTWPDVKRAEQARRHPEEDDPLDE